jgi:hypothetical protein
MRSTLVLCLVSLVRAADAQAPSGGAGATVSGVVRDSIAHRPLAGAIVQIVATRADVPNALSAVSDSLGNFTIRGVATGRHTIGFFHPMLDSLGINAPQHEVEVRASETVRVDLGIPSAARLWTAICGKGTTPTHTLVVGFVRQASGGAQVEGANVTAHWTELTFGGGRPVLRSAELAATTATTASNGWFAICSVPSSGTFFLTASHGADTTDLIELEMPPDGFLRRDLHVGRVAVTDSSGPAERTRRGEGRLRGTIVAQVDGRPLGGAVVGIVDGPHTRTNDRGEWNLVGAPIGTRMLEIRALGYYPTRRAVDVVDSAPPIRIALPTLKAVLDTVKVTAARIADRYKRGFAERQRTGLGYYLTADQIGRRKAVTMSQVLRMISGLRLDVTMVRNGAVYDSTGALLPSYTTSNSKILMRGSTDDWCYPAIYIDGQPMQDLDADDLDKWVRPEEVLGIEVYPGVSAPAEFQQAMTGCGSILIWRK